MDCVEELRRLSTSLPAISKCFSGALNELARQSHTKKWSCSSILIPTRPQEQIPTAQTMGDDADLLISLCNALNDYSSSITDLYNTISSSITASSTLPTASGARISVSGDVLIGVAGRCLRASEHFKKVCLALKPTRNTDEGSEGISGKIKMLLNFDSSLKGTEKLSFPYMRSFLKEIYQAKTFEIQGSSQNVIDVVWISASSVREYIRVTTVDPSIATHNTASSASQRLVLFCSPNAGFYECLSQADLTSSWLGVYTKAGFDLCTFNYRGYNQSTGSPAPAAVKEDGVAVLRYLLKTMNPSVVVVHGESIGGERDWIGY